jgi:hypothetical protein
MNTVKYKLGGMFIRVVPHWTIFANQKTRTSHTVTVYGWAADRRTTIRTFDIIEVIA